MAGEHLRGDELAAGLTAALGEQVTYNRVTPAAYRSFGFPGADELANMFQFNAEFAEQYCAARDLAASQSLNPRLTSYEAWLEQSAEKIPLG